MNKLQFDSLSDLNKAVIAVMKTAGISSRTNEYKAQARAEAFIRSEDNGFAFDSRLYKYNLDQVYYAIRYGRATGRFHYEAEKLLKDMSPYQFHKFCAKLAFYGATVADLVPYINGNASLEVPIK